MSPNFFIIFIRGILNIIRILEMSIIMENNKSYAITIISDIHLLSDKLMANNEKFKSACLYDRKFLVEGKSLLHEALNKASDNKTQYLLIPGDLTKDGEKQSHIDVSKILKKWKDQDEKRQVFILPGNHDINNNSAYDYKNNIKATKTSPKDFFEIYSDFYGQNIISYYKDSDIFKNYLTKINKKYKREEKYSYYAQGYGSYLARFDCNLENKNSVSIIALDSSIYSCDVEQNNKDDKCNVIGFLSKELLRWACNMI